MAETLFDLSFDSESELNENNSRLLANQRGGKTLGTPPDGSDSALNIKLGNGEYRSEIGLRAYRDSAIEEGGHYTAEWKMYLPDDFSQGAEGWGTIVQQWGANLNGNTTKLENPGQSYISIGNDLELTFRPTVYEGQENGKYLLGHKTYSLGKIEKNKWINFKQEFIPAADGTGLMKLWKDGELVANYQGPNLPPKDGYDNLGIWKVGAYTQRNNNGTRSLWYDDLTIRDVKGEVQTAIAPVPSNNDATSTPSSNASFDGVDISGMPLKMWNRAEGSTVSRSFEIGNLNSLQNPKLEISAFDIDERSEVELKINDRVVSLPDGIIQRDGGTLNDAVDIDKNILVEGRNEIAFEFASNLNNSTNGFAIEKLTLA
jgi:hypothetical protein